MLRSLVGSEMCIRDRNNQQPIFDGIDIQIPPPSQQDLWTIFGGFISIYMTDPMNLRNPFPEIIAIHEKYNHLIIREKENTFDYYIIHLS